MDTIIKICIKLLNEIQIKDEFINPNIEKYILPEDISKFKFLGTLDKANCIEDICYKYILKLLTEEFKFPDTVNDKDKFFRFKKDNENYFNNIELRKKEYKWLNYIFKDEGAKKLVLFHEDMYNKCTLIDDIKMWIKGASCELLIKLKEFEQKK